MNPIVPTVGRIVLYRGMFSNGLEIPAIVTAAPSSEIVNLTVFPDGGFPQPVHEAQYCEGGRTHEGADPTWRWMPYQRAVAAGEIEATRHDGRGPG